MTKEFCRVLLPPNEEMEHFQNLMASMLNRNGRELTPNEFFYKYQPPGFEPGLQQDSTEFLKFLLQKLHEQEQNLFRRYPQRTTTIEKTFVDLQVFVLRL